jgi:hypothetical protein
MDVSDSRKHKYSGNAGQQSRTKSAPRWAHGLASPVSGLGQYRRRGARAVFHRRTEPAVSRPVSGSGPLPNSKAPAWDVVRNRYWKNRHEASKGSGEFSPANMNRMKRGSAPLDANGNSMELHHHNPQRNGGASVNNPRNLREVTREQHAALDEFTQRIAGMAKGKNKK